MICTYVRKYIVIQYLKRETTRATQLNYKQYKYVYDDLDGLTHTVITSSFICVYCAYTDIYVYALISGCCAYFQFYFYSLQSEK